MTAQNVEKPILKFKFSQPTYTVCLLTLITVRQAPPCCIYGIIQILDFFFFADTLRILYTYPADMYGYAQLNCGSIIYHATL